MTIIPAPFSLNIPTTSASTSLFQGHCPYFSMAFSSILTMCMSCEISFSSDCNNKSNDFNLNISFICGSFNPINVTTNKVTKANVQCVNIFFIKVDLLSLYTIQHHNIIQHCKCLNCHFDRYKKNYLFLYQQ